MRTTSQGGKRSRSGPRRSGKASGAGGKRSDKIVLDERAQEQPSSRKVAQRSGRPTRRSGA